MSNYYNQEYFKSEIFDYDYSAIADAIIGQYDPKSVIEFGCGNGDLSRAFAEKGIRVEAIDGYATPDFGNNDLIRFTKVNLNNADEVEKFLASLQGSFDVAFSSEVGEHLDPAVSPLLIKWMTAVSDTVIFSSAVPEQGGDGHINCRPREYWHKIFKQHGFMIADTIREKIRDNHKVARWYRHNLIDFCRTNGALPVEEYEALVERLVRADSAASSDYYLAYRKMEFLQMVLDLQPMRLAFTIRNRIKRLMGKPVIKVK